MPPAVRNMSSLRGHRMADITQPTDQHFWAVTRLFLRGACFKAAKNKCCFRNKYLMW